MMLNYLFLILCFIMIPSFRHYKSFYRPCKTTLDGLDTRYRSLLSYANTNNLPAPLDPHKQFILDLQAWIEMLQVTGSSIILNIDENEDTYSCIA